jgi:MFS family permease
LYGVSQIGMGILAPTVPLYIDSQFGIQQKDLSLAFIGPALLVALIAIPLGRLPDSIGRARAVWISYAMAMVGMFLCAVTGWLHPTTHLLSMPVVLFGAGMLLLVISYILGTPAWLGLTSLQVSDRQQAQALSLMQTAQGFGVVIAFALVASAGHLLTQWKKVGARIDAKIHHRAVEVIHQSQDTVPLSIWFWASCAIFALCLIGTLLWVQEPAHDAHEEQLAREAEKPFADFSNTEDA